LLEDGRASAKTAIIATTWSADSVSGLVEDAIVVGGDGSEDEAGMLRVCDGREAAYVDQLGPFHIRQSPARKTRVFEIQ
jgi:hypothetical protein